MAIPSQLIGISTATRQVLEDVNCAAVTDAKVLITGESGVGKEIAAQLIHQRGRRSSAKLIAINCAGVPDSLLASELFGHTRGSFTDAYCDKQGWLEQAHHGTIFMDEVGEMSLQMQAAMLRFLDKGEIQRVGSERRSSIVDVRIIAATNRRLIELVAAKEFREDLFYRLNVIHIEIPPLRERREDVPPLVEHFLEVFSKAYRVRRPVIRKDALEQLVNAAWPGNVRQLKNVLERLVVSSARDVITAAELPREVLSMVPADTDAPDPSASASNEELFQRIVRNGESFWTVVYTPFMAHDLTRDAVRKIVKEGLLRTHGGYKAVAALFNIPGEDRRLLSFLRKHGCYLPEPPRQAAINIGSSGATRAREVEYLSTPTR